MKVDRDSSRFIKEDLKFSLGDLMMGLDDSARQLLHVGRSGERFGFIIHGWVTSHLHYDIHMKRKLMMSHMSRAQFRIF